MTSVASTTARVALSFGAAASWTPALVFFGAISIAVLAGIEPPYTPISSQTENSYRAGYTQLSTLNESYSEDTMESIWYYNEPSDVWTFYSLVSGFDEFNTLLVLQPRATYSLVLIGEQTISSDGNDYQLSDGLNEGL